MVESLPPTFEQACALVEARRDDLIALLRQVIAVDTQVPPGRNYDTLLDILEPRYQAMGFTTERVLVPPEKLAVIPWPLEGPRPNLVAVKQWPGNTEWVTSYAHMDVVPIEERWTHDPFAGEIVDGVMYGRGVADMKGSMVALIVALEVMHQLGLPCRYNMVSTLCTDEEVGIYPGIRYLAEQGYLRGHILTLESAGQDPTESYGASGAIDFIVTVQGRSSHSGRNYRGINAVEQLVPIMDELLKLKELVERRESRFPNADPEAPTRQMNAKMSLTMVNGGVKSNIVPATASLVVNRRTIPEESMEDVIQEFQNAVDRGRARGKALGVEVQTTLNYPPVTFNLDSPYAERRRAAMRAVKGYTELARTFGGGSVDIAFVQQVLGTDLIVPFGPGRMATSNAHGADENIHVQDLVDEVKELVHYLAY
jgi:succinyl-diaminopimelate desuccinylase